MNSVITKPFRSRGGLMIRLVSSEVNTPDKLGVAIGCGICLVKESHYSTVVKSNQVMTNEVKLGWSSLFDLSSSAS
jgi:hypothetical protein